MEKSLEILVSSPIGTNSEVLNINVAHVIPISGIKAFALILSSIAILTSFFKVAKIMIFAFTKRVIPLLSYHARNLATNYASCEKQGVASQN